MAPPTSLLEHLRSVGYHPRSDKHSNATGRAIVESLMRGCPRIASDAAAGQLVWQLNHDVKVGHSTWNTDLAIGPPSPSGIQPDAEQVEGMLRGTPIAVRIAVEHKAIMTEHLKARKNRKRDLEAHHAHVHEHDNRAIAAGLFVINASPTFRSPLRATDKPATAHRNVTILAARVIDELMSVTMAGGSHQVGLDAKGVLVLLMDNEDWTTTRYLHRPPAPMPGDPLHWDSFILRICDLYSRRF
jgi:hypothetical protein